MSDMSNISNSLCLEILISFKLKTIVLLLLKTLG